MRLFRVKLTDVDYDTYDAAIIACESKDVLVKLFEDGEFLRDNAQGLYKGNSPRVEYDYNFDLTNEQRIDDIEGIGFTSRTTDKEAIVLLSSFNAG